MRIVRVAVSGGIHLARVEHESYILLHRESAHPAADALREALDLDLDLAADGERVAASAAALLAPVIRPSKVIAVGLNYADHARESGVDVPSAPLLFTKSPGAIIGPGDAICFSRDQSSQVDYESELAVVIGSRAQGHLSDPMKHVFGYTICNDVSARDAQFGDGQWVRGKSFDTFCPLGPWIITSDELSEPQALGIGCTVSGEKLQDGSTQDMIFSVAQIITYVASFMTLEPGDVIATGTPFGVGFAREPKRFLGDGDEVTCWIEGVGELTNPVRER
jgi:2-keto-4-pentenoate hydratase/2-oxohepta-3-ene-1,7-dioic acid hydratase in catechol pathway